MRQSGEHPKDGCGPAWKAAEEWGCDMDQLMRNLALSPAERVRRHWRALAAANQLRAGTGTLRDGS